MRSAERFWTPSAAASRKPGSRALNAGSPRSVLAKAQRSSDRDAPAIAFQSETRPRLEISWSALAAQVGALTATLERLGVARGDRVVSYLPNIPETVAALLAAASLGAVWSSCSPARCSAAGWA